MKNRKGRQKKTEQRMEAMGQIGEFQKASTSSSTKLVTMASECIASKNVARPRISIVRAQIACAASERDKPTSLAVHVEMKNMEVEQHLATHCVLHGPKVAGTRRMYEEHAEAQTVLSDCRCKTLYEVAAPRYDLVTRQQKHEFQIDALG